MCWFHMRKCANDKLAMLGDNNLAANVLRDTAQSQSLFDAAVALFLAKWRVNNNPHMAAYLTYFEKE